MLKKIGLLFGLLIICSYAKADMFEPDRVYQVAVSSVTMFKISVSSFAATQVDFPAMKERVAVEIQNIDSTASLWCVPGVAVSSAPVNGSRKIAAGNTWVLSMLDKFYTTSALAGTDGKVAVDIYCTTDSSTGSTNAVVTQIH